MSKGPLESAEALPWLSGADTKPVVVVAAIPDQARLEAEAGGAGDFSLPNR